MGWSESSAPFPTSTSCPSTLAVMPVPVTAANPSAAAMVSPSLTWMHGGNTYNLDTPRVVNDQPLQATLIHIARSLVRVHRWEGDGANDDAVDGKACQA
jgi:hypothetical protein